MALNRYTNFIPENVAPSGTKRINVYNSAGQKVGHIGLHRLAQPPQENIWYSFCAVSDVHITYNTAREDFQRALTYVENSDCLFTCVCGDLSEKGSDVQMEQFKTVVDSYAVTKPVYAITGNHDTCIQSATDAWISQYTGNPLYYSFIQGEDVFIMVGNYKCYDTVNEMWTVGEQFSDVELQWLYETLEANRNKRCFVFQHIFPWGGSGNANNIYETDMWTSTRGTVFENLMKHYKNVVVFHGHSHLKFDLQELDDKANYSNKDGYRSIHIPSLAVPRDIVDGSMSMIYAESEGYIVDVYENHIILNGRDFIDNDADGHWLPIATYKIDTALVEIEAGTFTDSTGTIVT